MKNIIIAFTLLITFELSSFAQDNNDWIILEEGDTIHCDIYKINSKSLAYQISGGTVATIQLSKVKMFESRSSVYVTLNDFLLIKAQNGKLETEKSGWEYFVDHYLALIIAIIAAIIALRTAKFNIVSSARIRWIEDLRNLISEFCDAAIMTTLLEHQFIHEVNPVRQLEVYNKYLVTHSRLNILEDKAKLMLNKNNHKRLEDRIIEVTELISDTHGATDIGATIKTMLDTIIEESRTILNDEWVKATRMINSRCIKFRSTTSTTVVYISILFHSTLV